MKIIYFLTWAIFTIQLFAANNEQQSSSAKDKEIQEDTINHENKIKHSMENREGKPCVQPCLLHKINNDNGPLPPLLQCPPCSPSLPCSPPIRFYEPPRPKPTKWSPQLSCSPTPSKSPKTPLKNI